MSIDKWARQYCASITTGTWPSESLVKILLGHYPNLSLQRLDYSGKRVCDIGCGDGRNVRLLCDLGFEVFGTESSDAIVKATQQRLSALYGLAPDLRVGLNHTLPFPTGFFDFAVAWCSAYYLSPGHDFPENVLELARILRPAGVVILAIPKLTNILFENSVETRPGYRRIIKGPFYGVRDGIELRVFKDGGDIVDGYQEYFTDFRFGSVDVDFFGRADCWHLAVFSRKSE